MLVLLLIVERQRVEAGIRLFETNPAMATFAAAVLVLLNLALEIQVHHIEHREGYQQSTGKRFSLRLGWQSVGYFLGLTQQWKPVQLSPAHRWR
jgi:hypothetical protein